MENEQKDKGLRKSLAARQQTSLPCNFTFRTMQMIEQDIARREQRHEQVLKWATVSVAILLPALSISVIYYFVDTNIVLEIKRYLQETFGGINLSAPVIIFSFMMALFLSFYNWMYDRYYIKRLKNKLIEEKKPEESRMNIGISG